MALFAVAFRIQDGPNYDARYISLTEAIEAAGGHAYWDEPTSFYLLESDKNSSGLKDEIVANSRTNSDDLLLVINLSVPKGHASRGVQDLTRFKAFMDSR
ncbi:hypothetical protein [Pelagibacterium sediminicola]|uniref:hypothetical protein n=1 Tax=Pelagibacterium sediminicola TaxID=2248761 RepID=UPI000E31C8AF|nr:hypothetical protein [Pelagibacterium sediminicola]